MATVKTILFSSVDVTRQVFYRTSLSYAIVNLKPIVPGREHDRKTYCGTKYSLWRILQTFLCYLGAL